jgi:hypothetical protein
MPRRRIILAREDLDNAPKRDVARGDAGRDLRYVEDLLAEEELRAEAQLREWLEAHADASAALHHG